MAISKIIYKSSAQDTGTVWMDSTPATASAADITAPKTAMLADGVLTTGTGSGGGGGTAVEEKDVNFIDDVTGSIVYSYTAAEFANLSALPANPSHSGLTAQGWNWSLSDAKTYVASYGKLWIGQMYTTSDGKTRIYIKIPDDTPSGHMTMYVRFTQSVAYGVSVDWGDGTEAQTYSGTTATNRDHTYANAGDYVITLNVTSGTVSFVGSSSQAIYGTASTYYRRNWIKKVEIGNNVSVLGAYILEYCYSLNSVTIPLTITSIEQYAFRDCYSIEIVNVPTNAKCANNTFTGAKLKNVSLPAAETSIYGSMFNACHHLTSISLPPDITSIGANAFLNCFSITSIIIPPSVTSIGGSAFSTCYGMNVYHFRPTTPPTLESTAFTNITTGTVIYVPYSADHSILEAYQTATNWSTYASYMQEEPA